MPPLRTHTVALTVEQADKLRGIVERQGFKFEPRPYTLYFGQKPGLTVVEVMHAIKKGVNDQKWNLLTGDKKAIYSLARKSYLAVKLGKPSELYDMVHTENFVLVDTKRRVRGFYDGTKKEEIQRLIEDINWLLTQE
jgi:protein SCO1/2